MYTLVQKRISAIPIMYWKRSSPVRRILATAEVIECKRNSDGARPDQVLRFGYKAVVQHGMVDANGLLRGCRRGRNAVDLFRIDRQRFFHQHVAAALESRNRQLRVSVGRSQNMNYVDSLVHHSFHRWEDFWDAEPGRQSCGARAYDVSDSHDPRARDTLNRTGVKFADVASSD